MWNVWVVFFHRWFHFYRRGAGAGVGVGMLRGGGIPLNENKQNFLDFLVPWLLGVMVSWFLFFFVAFVRFVKVFKVQSFKGSTDQNII